MLVLSRKKLESIRIGDNIEVVVLDVGRNRVRLGFRCPQHISVTRSELQQAVAAPQLVAAPERQQELVCA